jgi:hypothetical protein
MNCSRNGRLGRSCYEYAPALNKVCFHRPDGTISGSSRIGFPVENVHQLRFVIWHSSAL